jgi:hypothetical protein
MKNKEKQEEKESQCQAHAKEQEEIESKQKFVNYVKVPEGKLGVIKECGVNYEGRNILMQQIEDGSVGIHIARTDLEEQHPVQQLRLNELTLNLLLLAIFEAGRKFNIDFEKITEEINQNLEKKDKDEKARR